ncbi:MAG: hypothetical protein JWR25_759 [Noviherbaspirillum sp.]|nr:hypothetical protein [Noviherbaspirillum sp.]
MRSVVGPQHVARMAIAVQAQSAHRPCPLIATAHAVERLCDDTVIGIGEFPRHARMRAKIGTRLFAKRHDVQRRPCGEWPARADRMNAADEAAHPFEGRRVLELGRASAMPGKHGEAETVEAVQGRVSRYLHRGYHRDLLLCQFLRERMFFENGRIAPAPRPIELCNHRRSLFHADLVHAIFVAVERDQSPVAMEAYAVEPVEDRIRIEAGESMWSVINHGLHSKVKVRAKRYTSAFPLFSTSGISMQFDEPLSDKEFDELDQFLLSDRCAEDGMTMDTLHGYLTALVIGPEEVLMPEWLPRVWGAFAKEGPEFASEKESQRIVGLIARFMNEVAITFEVAPKEFEPLYCEHEWEGRTLIDAEAWAWGFWEGINLRAEAWEPIWSSNLADLMRPVYLLGAEEIEEEEMALVDDPVKRHKLAIELEAAILPIQRFWAPHRKSAVTQVQRDQPKVGRNDACPCASGKKYKKCCGVDQA